MLAAAGIVVLFALVQGFAVAAFDISFDAKTDLDTSAALDFALIQVAGLVVGTVLVFAGLATWRRIGAVAPAVASRRGLVQLAPVGLVVIAPPLVFALASGDPLVASRVDAPLAAALILLAVLIALNEELWFRGFVVDRLGGALRPWFTVLASALLFGAPHYAGSTATLLNAAAVGLAIGIPFAVVRLRAGSIWPLVAWHAIVDAWAFLHTSSIVPEGDPSPSELLAGLVLPALVAAGYLAWLARGERTAA